MKQNEKVRQLNTLIELISMINSTFDPYEIKVRTIEAAMCLTVSEAGSLLLVDEEDGGLFFEVALGEKGINIKKVRLQPGQGIAGWVAEHRKPVISLDAPNDPRFFSEVDIISEFNTRSLVCVPVLIKGRLLGVIQAINKLEGEYAREDVELLETLANHVAVAMDNATMYHDQKHLLMSTIEALAETIEKRDTYTGGHTSRVRLYSMAIGREMGLEWEDLEVLELAAVLHDIGKIGIRDGVLLKKGQLTEDEYEEMVAHSGFGVEIIRHIGKLRAVLPTVQSHHERIDGTGYPDRISGDDIPLLARIIAVADAFDAMTSDRPYRKRRSAEDAIHELERCSGRQFDARAVRAFVSVWENKTFPIPENLLY